MHSFTQGEVKLHRYIRLQGQLSGNTEACNQTWPNNARLTKLGLERKDVLKGVYKGFTMVAYSPRLWLMAAGEASSTSIKN
eukprot:1150382-Pelagomonas_calceolata.AAC.3